VRYPRIDAIPHITLEYRTLDYKTRRYYDDPLWHTPLTHVILTHDDSRANIDIAAELIDSAYRDRSSDEELSPLIHIAIHENRMIADEIDANADLCARCDPFACTQDMASKRWVLDEEHYRIGKQIHAGYRERYLPYTTMADQESIEAKWLKVSTLNDRPSNIAQAYHLPLKLKALGLTSRPSSLNPDNELIRHNRAMLNAVIGEELKSLGLDDASLTAKTKGYDTWEHVQTFDYFPTAYDTMVAKLIRAEHNRWNAFHYLRGWHHTLDTTDKPAKKHRCLVLMPEMDPRDRYTVLYDLLSILYIPNLLADAGYEIVEVDRA